MALSNFKVFDQFAQLTRTERLDYNFNLLNQASRGGITFRRENSIGDFSDKTFFKKASTVRVRNAYASTAIGSVAIVQDTEASVKLARGTPEHLYEQDNLRRIGLNPEAAGIAFGEQLAEQTVEDMVSTAIGAVCAALVNVGATVYQDYSGGTGGAELVSLSNLADLQQKLGDQSGRVKCWIMQSKNRTDLLKGSITNANHLFNFGDVNIMSDAQGRPIIVSDQAQLFIAGTPNDYYVVGLTDNGVEITLNDDWQANEVDKNGNEQIVTSYQAQWSYNMRLKGMTWDKTNGGRSPANAAVFTGTNWDKTATSVRDLPGIVGRFQ